MANPLWVGLICQAIVSVRCFSQEYSASAVPVAVRTGPDSGERLFLTPYIRSGRAAEGRRAARVRLPGPALESYAGFFTVDDTHNSNHFLWYFPPVAADAATAPVLVWLQGGPGTSSLFGLFTENGPLEVKNGSFTFRKHHWALNHHVIFIDNPVGAGFSFTDNEEGFCRNETQVGEQLYITLTQFFQLFPELQLNKFFITGESYAGKYIPALAYTIHKKNPTAKTKINLQGLAIGNGWSDPENQLVYSEYMYQIGVIDWNTKTKFEKLEAEAIDYIRKRDWDSARKNLRQIVFHLNVSRYDFTPLSKDLIGAFNSSMKLVQTSAVRKAIHVGDQPFNFENSTLENDTMHSVAPWISELLDHYPVVFYNGQFDIIVAYPLTLNFLRKLRFNGSEEYAGAERHEWRVGGQLAGFWKRGGRLTEVLVRGAGHMVPADQPAWAHDLITRVTHGGF